MVGDRGVVIRNGVRYYVEIIAVSGGEYLVQSYTGYKFFGWIAFGEFING